jgi:hypothetical protein
MAGVIPVILSVVLFRAFFLEAPVLTIGGVALSCAFYYWFHMTRARLVKR